VARDLVTIVISWTEDPKDPICPKAPPIVAKFVLEINVRSWPYLDIPKFASGSTVPPEDGASAIHSAEDLAAELTFTVVVKDCPVVTSEIVATKGPPV